MEKSSGKISLTRRGNPSHPLSPLQSPTYLPLALSETAENAAGIKTVSAGLIN